MTTPHLTWDIGTAYDLFISLYTLHHPDEFGLRGSWAAGVRSRLPTPEREFLQEIQDLMSWPISWVHSLPAPKDAQTALNTLAQIPSTDRLTIITAHPMDNSDYTAILHTISQRGQWQEAEFQTLLTMLIEEKGVNVSKKKQNHLKKYLETFLQWWLRREEFGASYLSSLQAYYEVFFAEDEKRIRPALEEAVSRAQKLAEELPIPALLEAISQGVQFEEAPDVAELVLAPSFWGSPLLFYGPRTPERMVLLFGGRPSTASMVPGDVISDALFQALRALADPTRLRILRYLMTEPMTPAELARRLRLRAPTVVHHLHTLRLARLVYLTISHDGKRYQARREAINETYAMLDAFLGIAADTKEKRPERPILWPTDIPY
ncbi:MAG: helix-turn-helix domain-containing protein [Ardenticatenaceae bacterium]|nr:helix-turn-helix domain-containing protein [Ardenticatenaceae bacterium]